MALMESSHVQVNMAQTAPECLYVYPCLKIYINSQVMLCCVFVISIVVRACVRTAAARRTAEDHWGVSYFEVSV